MSEGGETYEDFWGCTLTKGKNEAVWSPLETEDDIEHKLQLTSACLGAKAKDGERNLVEVTTANDNGDEVVCSIVSLRAGGNECMHLELGFNNPAKFKLCQGSGPLSLCGTHLKAAPLDMMDDDDDDFSDEEDDEDIPNLVEPKKVTASKPVTQKEKDAAPAKKEPSKEEKKTEDKPGKRPLEDKKDKQIPSKKKKVEPEPEESEDEDEDEDEDEESGNENEDEGSDDEEMPSLLDGEAVEDDDEESEDEDEPEEGDDVDSEEDEEEEGSDDDEGEEESDEDEDEDDEEESEEEEKTPAKKPLTNGHAKKTPAKKEEKTPAKTPSKAAGAKKGMDEIKSMLLKSPNLPKKFDKFANYMKNNMKVTDKKIQQDVWDFVQKNRK